MSSTHPRVYIAGPITGIQNFNHKAFYSSGVELWHLGFLPVNPHNICRHILRSDFTTDEQHWQACLKADMPHIISAHYMLMLDGWQQSRGACFERQIALTLGIPVFYSINELEDMAVTIASAMLAAHSH